MKYPMLILLLFLFWLTPGFAQKEWKLAKDKNDIQVYTRKTETSTFIEFKGVTFLDAKVSSFVAVMQDAENMTNWVYSIVEAQLLEMPSDTVMSYYAESKLPWPFDNRDAVYQDIFQWDAAKRTLTVKIDCLPKFIEEKKGIVRIPYAKGFWRVEEVEKNRLKITFQMIVDPGGTIPAWLVNAFVVDSPYETLKGIKEVIQDEKYQNASYDFIY